MQVAYVVPDIDTAIRRTLNSGIGPVFVMRQVRLLARHKGRENSLLITVALAYSRGIQYEFVQQHDDTPSAYLDFTAAHPHGGFHHVAHFCENFDQPLRHARELGTEFEIVQEFLAPDGTPFEIYVRPKGVSDPLVTQLSLTNPLRAFFAQREQAAQGWDGNDPIRDAIGCFPPRCALPRSQWTQPARRAGEMAQVLTTSVEETAGCGLAPLARRPVLLIAAAAGAVLVAVSPRYGYFGDELYFLEDGRHPAWSYADQPPLLARGLDVLAGGSLVGLRLLPALVTAAGVLVTALLARELGGGRRAQVLAAALAATSTFLLGTGHLLATSTLDPWLWAVCTWLLVRWVRTGNDRLLLWLGLVTAVALRTKYLIVAFWALVVLTALIAGPRTLPTQPRLWLAGGFAVLTSVPALLWQAEHGWPQLAMSRQVAAEQQAMGGMLTFLPLVLLSPARWPARSASATASSGC